MENNERKPVNIFNISRILPLYKDGNEAEKIELIQLREVGFEIVSQKGLYKVGDKAIYIQPDYCLPDDIELFQSFTAPGGDPNKSKLGKNNRIRALKFNFTKSESSEPIYSMGILIPFYEVKSFLGDTPIFEDTLTELLKVIKYEEPEAGKIGQQKGDIPLGMYKTDEDNFENYKYKIEYPQRFIGTLKVDGSSITVYVKNEEEYGICSRTFEKKLNQDIIIGYSNIQGDKLRKHYDRETLQQGWLNERTLDFYVEVPEDFQPIMGVTEDSWVKLGSPILEKLLTFYKETGRPLVARGEIFGEGLKGSGNKNNPHSKLKQGILIYGLDDYTTGITRKIPMDEVLEICKYIKIDTVPVIFNKTFNYEKELRDKCNNYFKENMVEGIVIRSWKDTKISTKFMNPIYDSSK